MKKEELNRLLERYYEGKSSEEEEQSLRLFFSGDDIPPGYDVEKALFSYFLESSEIPEPSAEFEKRIIESFDNNDKITLRFRKHIFTFAGIAAGITILIGSWFYFTKVKTYRDTFTDPELAYAATIKILYSVSSDLNKSAMIFEPVSKMATVNMNSLEVFNVSAENAGKKLKSLSHLNKAFDIISEPEEKNK